MVIDKIAHTANQVVVDAQQNVVQVVSGFIFKPLRKVFCSIDKAVGRLAVAWREQHHNFVLNIQILKYFGCVVVVACGRKKVGHVLSEGDFRNRPRHCAHTQYQKAVEQHFMPLKKVVDADKNFAHWLWFLRFLNPMLICLL